VVFEDALQAIRSAKAAGMTVYGVYDKHSPDSWEEIKRTAHGVLEDFENGPLL
jgi:beta-phosphoglucomutase-like phosphatase (HAD superfamily)